MEALKGLLFINDIDAYVAYGAFLSADRRGEFRNLSALLTPPTMKPYVAVAFREEDGEQLPQQLPTPAFEARDIDLRFAIVADSAAEFMQRYADFVAMLRSGWLELRVADVPGKIRVYYKSSTEFSQLTPIGGGAVAGKFNVKFREPNPASR
ncbi:MAG: hypothetical protein LBV18_04065 [Alistipes sp.]|jgi:hypothetical protein|nr:hypothetical protein [Alistipes sp.]